MVDVAGQRGCAAPSVGLVVAQAGMSRRTFYECFDGREACVLALLDLGLERIGGLVGRRLCGRTRDRTGCAWRWRRLIRRSSRNVTRWQSGDMCLRWTAAGMLEAEIQFRKVVGYAELAKLAVERDLRASTPLTVAPNRPPRYAPRPRTPEHHSRTPNTNSPTPTRLRTTGLIWRGVCQVAALIGRRVAVLNRLQARHHRQAPRWSSSCRSTATHTSDC
jgi:AcrR family transcriptional regulator